MFSILKKSTSLGRDRLTHVRPDMKAKKFWRKQEIGGDRWLNKWSVHRRRQL